MTVIYNEIDPFAAQWLRNLIAAGHIANGVVDERSVEDLDPEYLRRFVQVHLFAGIGVWSAALRRAGWSDDRPIWTMSCPCQPFSAAGKGDGFADERHLWPAAFHLVSQCRPSKIVGEQVASKAVDPWIDLVHADLEALGYAFGSVPFPSAGVGAPHIRDRNYWAGRLADLHSNGREARGAVRPLCQEPDVEHGGTISGMADTRLSGDRCQGGSAHHWQQETNGPANRACGCSCSPGGMEDADVRLTEQFTGQRPRPGEAPGGRSCGQSVGRGELAQSQSAAGPTNGIWAAADWLLCRDGKWRPVEPATFPLADARTYRNRVAELRGAGNAINIEAARAWIETIDTPVNPAP